MSSYRSTIGGNYWRPSFFGGFSFFPPVIKVLLISNTALWLITDLFLGDSVVQKNILTWFALSPIGENFYPWQLVTYMFLHGGFGHLFFNMLALWMFGMEMENLWGSKRFLVFYLICGIGGGISNLIIAPLVSPGVPTLGASGAVFGVLTAFGLLFPERPIYLYFLLPIRAKFFVAGYIILELIYGVSGTASGVAHFAHLGGALVGFLMMLGISRGWSFENLWGKFIGEPKMSYDPRRARKPVREEVFDAKFFDIQSGRPMEREDELSQEVVDSILDKINRTGYQSLSAEEKRILNEASKKIN